MRTAAVLVLTVFLLTGCAKKVNVVQPMISEETVKSIMQSDMAPEKKVEAVNLVLRTNEAAYKEKLLREADRGKNLKDVFFQIISAGLAAYGAFK